MSGKFRIATVLVVLGLLLTACAAPVSPGPRSDRGAGRKPSRQNPPPAPQAAQACRRARESGRLVVGRAGSTRR